jgi:hypothetical protein
MEARVLGFRLCLRVLEERWSQWSRVSSARVRHGRRLRGGGAVRGEAREKRAKCVPAAPYTLGRIWSNPKQ